ncbi:TRAP transporter permease [Thermodesulfobacteriota bacterium]
MGKKPKISNKFRDLSGASKILNDSLMVALTLLGALWALKIHDIFAWQIFLEQYLALVLGIGLISIFLGTKAWKGEPAGIGIPWYDWIAAAASTLVCGFVIIRYPVLITEISLVTYERLIFGIIAIVLVMEATRRLSGWVLIWVAVIFIFYARFSHLMPSILNAPSTEWDRLITYFYLDTNAIFGLPLSVFSNIVIPFILFGQILYMLNADRFLNQVALATMGRFRGGPAKVALGASSLFGTISGSVVSNVVMDGPITIPMMVRTGYKRHIAAAIEAVASTGGQIMPPVMGITAFLIADFLGIPYSKVVFAAIVPAILYYVAVFIQIDLEAARGGMVGLPVEDLPKLRKVSRQGWVFVVPFAILIYTLVIAFWQPGKAAMAAVIAALLTGMLKADTRPTVRKLWDGFLKAGRTLLSLVPIVAVAGLAIGALQISGLAFGMSLILVTLAGGSLLLLLFMTSALSIVLGMGLPTSVIYLLLAVLVAPALVDFGVPELGAHMFLFYFGMLSMITPPLCFATFAAATVANCNLWKAGWAGLRIGVVAYIIPFLFIFQPELLLVGGVGAILISIVTALIGISLIATGFAGYIFHVLSKTRRVLLVICGLLLIPSMSGGSVYLGMNIAGAALGLLVLLAQYRTRSAAAGS